MTLNPSKLDDRRNHKVYSSDGIAKEVIIEGWCNNTRYIPVSVPTRANEGGQLGTVYPASYNLTLAC